MVFSSDTDNLKGKEMQSGGTEFYRNNRLTLFCDQSKAFQRNLVALVKQWDKDQNIRICSAPDEAGPSQTSVNSTKGLLFAVDQDGERWLGAEAVPIIFKSLPFGKLAAAMYILPGTMWVTRQLYEMDAHIKVSPNKDKGV
jgi:predicted DCC family thiol-disulfide oxidoreductase YuxK